MNADAPSAQHERIRVVGLGYVGLPLALALGRVFRDVRGYDVDVVRIRELVEGRDGTGQVPPGALAAGRAAWSAEASILEGGTAFVVTVPTPVGADGRADTRALLAACADVGAALRPGGLVVFESTVPPGTTEDVCAPALERASGLARGRDFSVGYSPERINPGDAAHGLGGAVKVIAADGPAALERMAGMYGAVVEAGLHRAPGIRVAEAAKLLENVQRDVNIALINELSRVFDAAGISTRDVVAAAATKWNFARYVPGLVGGPCVGVAPHFLAQLAMDAGVETRVTTVGREVNPAMGLHAAQRLVGAMERSGITVRGARIGVMGLAFKEDVADARGSGVPSLVEALASAGAQVLVTDPQVPAAAAWEQHGIRLQEEGELVGLSGLVLAVPHARWRGRPAAETWTRLARPAVVLDLKWMLADDEDGAPAGVACIRL